MSVVAVQKTKESITFAWDTKTVRYNQFYTHENKVIQYKNVICGFVGKTKILPYLDNYLKKVTSSGEILFEDEYSVCKLFDEFKAEIVDLEGVSLEENDNIIISDSKKVFNIYPHTQECNEVIDFEAIGSGAEYAYGAYKAGADIKKACEIACELNIYCGLPVKTLTINL